MINTLINVPEIDTRVSEDILKLLPNDERVAVAESKYAEAVALYASSELTIREVARLCDVSARGLSAHIARHHRDVLFARYGLEGKAFDRLKTKVKATRGQSLKTHLKYKDAIEACGDAAYIEFNVSQVARLFNLDGTALANQLRAHYPDIIPNRERIRKRLGIADNTHRGARPESARTYARALEMYRDTDMTIPQIARICNVSKGGLTQFMTFYHKNIMDVKAARRLNAAASRELQQPGRLAGNGNLYGPKPETVALYAPALKLYRTTPKTLKEIIRETGVPAEGFRSYINRWHRGERLLRRGYEWDGKSYPELKGTKNFLKSTSAKYAPAISSLKANPRNVTDVAAEYGLHPDAFREYLKTHEPELAARQGMTRLSNGRTVKRSSFEKYKAAVEEYANSTDTLKSIAQKHGLVYQSLMGYVLRNCSAERERHALRQRGELRK